MWMFQRWAYRIYLQGYWLHGGELTFWFQPFYRWIAGALHLVFGDSSMGEFWWDGDLPDGVCVVRAPGGGCRQRVPSGGSPPRCCA